MSAPLVAITSYVEAACWGRWVDVPATLVPHAYVQHVQQAGGVALVVPPIPSSCGPEHAEALLDRVDALILTGGVDVESSRYGADPHPLAQPPRPDRDSSELLLAQVSAERGLPVLGICRGMQVMAVAAGGTLEQHLPDRLGHEGHSPAPGSYGAHPVTTAPGSRVRELLGEVVDVSTYHHQGVATYSGLRATAWAEDGLVEALEGDGDAFRLAVQWHPEVGTDPRLFTALIAAAAAYR